MVLARDLPDIVEQRSVDRKALDRFEGLSLGYTEWHNSIRDSYSLYAQDWPVDMGGGEVRHAGPKVPDFVQLTMDSKALGAFSARPALVCRPPKLGDAARAAAELRERIIAAYWDHSQVMRLMPYWAYDAMIAGITICRVWPEFDKGRDKRFPKYDRLDPLTCFPDPVFARGPYVDSMVRAYQENIRTVEERFGVQITDMRDRNKNSRIQVIEYIDKTDVKFVAEYPKNNSNGKGYAVLLDEKHKTGCTPVVIGTKPTPDGLYHGMFKNAEQLLLFWNNFATMMLDDAVRKVYPETIRTEGVNTDEGGPDGVITLETPTDRYEKVQQPNQPFTNMQFHRDMASAARDSSIFPRSVSGDPDESVISAAGINAAGSEHLKIIAFIQTGMLAPMLQCANSIALEQDVVWSGDVTKTIRGGKKNYREDYNPTKDIGDEYDNEVVYGANSELDAVNRGVFAAQQFGAGLLPKRMAMEMNPAIQDVDRALKEQMVEKLTEAGVAGLTAAAAQGQLPSEVWAKIMRAIKEDDYSLEKAVEEFMVAQPLAQAPGSAPIPNAPGIAGAQEGQEPGPSLPDLAALGL